MPVWRRDYPGVETMTVAVMGCVVNGPGESKHANIGISLPGSGENPVAPVYVDGSQDRHPRRARRSPRTSSASFNDYVIARYGASRLQRTACARGGRRLSDAAVRSASSIRQHERDHSGRSAG